MHTSTLLPSRRCCQIILCFVRRLQNDIIKCCNYKNPRTFLLRVFRFTVVCHRPYPPAPFWSSYIKLNSSSYPFIISAYGFLFPNTQPTVCALSFFHAPARWGCSGKWILYAPALQLTKQPIPTVCKLNPV